MKAIHDVFNEKGKTLLVSKDSKTYPSRLQLEVLHIVSRSPGSSRETGRRRMIGMIFACSTLTIPFAAKFPLVIEKDLLSAEKNVSASNMIGTKFWS